MKNNYLTTFIFSLLLANQVLGSAINPQANEFYKKAENDFKSKDLNSAESNLTEALKIEPDNANYRYILGQVQLMKNNFIEAKNNMEIVSHSRPSQEKGADYNGKLKNYKKKIKDLQSKFNAAGDSKFSIYEKNKNSPQKLKLAVTVYQAFRLNPPLRYKNVKLLEDITKTYEENLQKSIEGSEWQKEPMLQLAFLYEIANKKDKAAEVYMRALDYISDSNEEFVITHKFDYLNRSNKEKLLDTIEAGEFSRKDIKEMISSKTEGMSDDEKEEIENMAAKYENEFKTKYQELLENAETNEERDEIMEKLKKDIMERSKDGGDLAKFRKRLEKEGKNLDDFMN